GSCSRMDLGGRLASGLDHRYRIESEIGAGGMAVVYRAHDLKHGRPVAIKVLRPEIAAAMGPERFLREIEIAARLNHPNILALHDSGEADGLLYFVMPFVEEESLRERLEREERLSVPEAVRVASQVASALGFAHARGLVHRDVKPGNVLFQAGQAMVCDFGIARAASEAQDRLTRTGTAIGTLAYMSPEQSTGDGEVDGRTDVYALGCLVYEMLAGQAPFAGPTAQAVLGRKLVGSPPDVTAVRPDVPATVADVIRRALAIAPDDRYPTAEGFARALEEATTEHAVLEAERRRRWRSVLRATGAGAMLALLATVGLRVAHVLDHPSFERVAVLPIANRANDPDQEYFVQGMHQDLILELARAGIRVINASSVARYSGTDRTVRDIAAELGVDGVIQGSATHAGDSISVELVLVDPATQELVWVESFGSLATNVVALYRRMTRTIADRMGVRLSAEARARLAEAPQVDPQVYEWLLQARFQWQKLTPEGFDAAEAYYRLALERDSTSVEAWAGISAVWGMRVNEGLIPAEESMPHRDSALARAAAIDPTFSADRRGLAVRKTWYDWSWDEADEAFTRALREDPTDSVTRAYYALLLLYTGRLEEAAAEMERAAGTDPLNTLVQGLYAQGLNALHRYDEAEAHLVLMQRREPDAPIVLSTLRTTYHLMGRHEDAIRMWQTSYADDPEALAALEQGWERGGYEAALQAVADLFVVRSDTMFVRPWQIGTLHTRAGMAAEAMPYLEQAYRERDPNVPDRSWMSWMPGPTSINRTRESRVP
ncbi:MAG TPA: protein kinase, partial [Longimicrobiales bacterium]|nr:protein kinase [Longimicrobiales bacterium]